MIKRKGMSLLLAALVVLAQAPLALAQQGPLAGFDEYATKALADWGVPGIAVAVVKDDKVVFAKGYGVRKVGESAPVDEKTLFAIGSSSKAFTAAALGILVDEGKVKWDEPAATYLPGFQLYDPFASREMTVRDLLTHRSGLDRAEFLWYATPYSREEILRRVRHVKPSSSFRSAFGYQNIMYLAAGQVAAAVSGKSWDDFVEERIFEPLGMTSSNTTIRALAGNPNVAAPHARAAGKVQAIPYRNIDNIAPAGSINSNAVDMAQWVRLQLNGGTFNGRQILKPQTAALMHEPQSILPNSPEWEMFLGKANFRTYGLGWFVHDYQGRKAVQHGGAIDGMHAMVGMIPEIKLGVVVLSNLQGNNLPTALMFRIFDAYLGLPARDWSAERLKWMSDLQARAEAARKQVEGARVKDTKPTLPLEKYVGTYTDEALGEARVALENGKLVVHLPGFVADLDHWHYDTFRATLRGVVITEGGQAHFTLNPRGGIDSLTMTQLGLSFKRLPDAAAGQAAGARR